MKKDIIKKYLTELAPGYGIYETFKRKNRKEYSISDNWGIFLGAYQGVATSMLLGTGLEKILQFIQ